MRLPCVDLDGPRIIRNEEKLSHILKIAGDKLLKDLLTNKIFFRKILSWNFKMKFCLNRRLVWDLLGWKLIALTAFFCKIKICFILRKFRAQTKQQQDK